MNRYIRDLVTLLYKEKMELYEKTRHYCSYEEQLNNRFYRDNNINDMLDVYWIAEDYHISNVFDNVIDCIEKIYFKNKDKIFNKKYIEFYTGYNFNNNTSLCNKLDNEKIKYPIYLRIAYNDENSTYAAVLNKAESNNKIIIELNSANIKDNKKILRSSCKHEFLHIRESYAKEYVDVLLSIKNRLPLNNEDNIFTWKNATGFFNLALRVCYLFNKAEMRARLNGVYEYVKDENIKLSDLDLITLLDEMKEKIMFMKMLKSQNNYSALEIYNYYLVKYNIVKTKFINYHFNEKIMQFSKYTNDDVDRLDAMIFELQEQYMKFKRDIQKVIYNKFHK